MQVKSEYVNVQGAELQNCGSTVWWELRGTIDFKSYIQACSRAGLIQDKVRVMESVSPRMAFCRAVGELASRHRLVRPLKGRGRYAIVDEQVSEEASDTEQTCRMWLYGETKGDGMVYSPRVEPPIPGIVAALSLAYSRHLDILTHDDVSWWLKTTIASLEGIRLRQRGGVYFVPANGVPTWRKVCAALGQCSDHLFHEMETIHSDHAVEAILSSVTRDAKQATTEFEEALVEQDLGTRALANRVQKCKDVRSKIAKYEVLLGASLDNLKSELLTLEGQLAAAHLASMGEDAA